MRRKGATIAFEQVMLFVVGITIFLICFSIFSSYEFYFTQSITQDQIEDVSEGIVSKILVLSGREETNSTARVTVPETIGNERYLISLNQSGLELKTFETGQKLFTPLSSINHTFMLNGIFSTFHGSEFLIYKKGNQIIIG